jgi:hypothetical protein
MVGTAVQEQVELPPDIAVPLLSEEETDAETVLVGAPAAAAPPESAASPEMQIV